MRVTRWLLALSGVLIVVTWAARADAFGDLVQSNGRHIRCADVAAIVEAIERTEPERRQAAIDAWKRYVVTVDVGLLHLIQLAQNHIEAGITSAQAWRECPAY